MLVLLVCVDCEREDETVTFNEDNQALMCSDCVIEQDLADWLDWVMEEFAPLSWW